MKKCTGCKKYLDLNNFCNNKAKEDGLNDVCRSCKSIRYDKYKKTKKGVVGMMYAGQLNSSRKRGHEKPNYSLKDLRLWCYSQEIFHSLYDKWVESDYKKDKKPSCDRVNEWIGYSFDNIRLVSFKENNCRKKVYRNIETIVFGDYRLSLDKLN